VAVGQIFHCHYHSINDPYSFLDLSPALYNLNNWQCQQIPRFVIRADYKCSIMWRGGGHLSNLFCVISGFRRDVHEICDHLGFYATSSGNPIPTFRAKLSDPPTRVSVEWKFHADSRNLSVEMGQTGCPETSVRNCQATPREIPDKSGFQVVCSFCQSFEFVPNTLVYY
jgi:hypothetical protein